MRTAIPEPDTDRPGEERVRERRHDAPHHEDRRESVPPTVREPAPEVEDVLDEREAHAGETGVDESVDDPVELAAPQQEHEQNGCALQCLLRQRRHDQYGRARVSPGVPDRLERGGVDGERPERGDPRPPREGEREQGRRLRLVAVEPQERGDDGDDGDRREHRAGDEAEDAGDAGDLGDREQPAPAGDDDERRPRRGRRAAWAGPAPAARAPAADPRAPPAGRAGTGSRQRRLASRPVAVGRMRGGTGAYSDGRDSREHRALPGPHRLDRLRDDRPRPRRRRARRGRGPGHRLRAQRARRRRRRRHQARRHDALDQMRDVVRADAHDLRAARRARRRRHPRRGAEAGAGLRPRARARAAQGAARRATRSAPTAASSPATCPSSTSHLHYRIVDVSSIKELARRWYPRVYFNAPEKHGGHRALADIRESIEELRYYRGGGLRAAARPGLGDRPGDRRAVRARARRLSGPEPRASGRR